MERSIKRVLRKIVDIIVYMVEVSEKDRIELANLANDAGLLLSDKEVSEITDGISKIDMLIELMTEFVDDVASGSISTSEDYYKNILEQIKSGSLAEMPIEDSPVTTYNIEDITKEV